VAQTFWAGIFMENVLEVKNLTKQFGDFVAVNDISFSLKEGEILGFLGVNGAGKTTTIQMLLNILKPTSGDISYFGKNLIRYQSEIMESVNFSTTYTQLPWNLTVKENLIYLSYLYDIKKRKQRIEKIIEIFNLQEFLSKTIGALSAGQKTKINLAKAFINFPKILLLDEPTASLDVETGEEMRQILLKERKEFNISMLFTSHNMAEVEEICDRIIFIHGGKIIANDSPENLAKTIQIAHVELHIKDGLKRLDEYATTRNLIHHKKGRDIVIDVNEKDIPDLLKDLMQHEIVYDEISIEKPTLEDYFMQVVGKAQYEI
jgi:ABC-2 type transport system ATP-binding protein